MSVNVPYLRYIPTLVFPFIGSEYFCPHFITSAMEGQYMLSLVKAVLHISLVFGGGKCVAIEQSRFWGVLHLCSPREGSSTPSGLHFLYIVYLFQCWHAVFVAVKKVTSNSLSIVRRVDNFRVSLHCHDRVWIWLKCILWLGIVWGLNNPLNCTRWFAFLHCDCVSTALIQESHLKLGDVPHFQNKHSKVVAHLCAPTKPKGVLIMHNRKLSLQIDASGGDEEDRLAYLVVRIHHIKMILISVYAPTDFKKVFLLNVCKSQLNSPVHLIALGADITATISPVLDPSTGTAVHP